MDADRRYRTIDQWEAVLGDQVRQVRIAQNLDQAQLAELADVSVGAVSNLERGKGSSLRTLIGVLRALGRTDWIESLAPAVGVSPMQLLRSKQKTPRPRARAGPETDAGRRALMPYEPVDVVEVRCWNARVGAIARDPTSGFYAFEYAPRWVTSAVELAPISMPTTEATGPFVFPTLPIETYRRLPAMIADALPDDFGNALTTAYLANEGIRPEDITPLDRLAYLGNRGVGALEFHPLRGPRTRKSTAIELSELVVAARSALGGRHRQRGRHHRRLAAPHRGRNLGRRGAGQGGGGAQPDDGRAALRTSPRRPRLRAMAAQVRRRRRRPRPRRDQATSAGSSTPTTGMALAAGIEMTECRLLEEGGRAHFMTRRFDRAGDGRKIHTQTPCAPEPSRLPTDRCARLRTAVPPARAARARTRHATGGLPPHDVQRCSGHLRRPHEELLLPASGRR